MDNYIIQCSGITKSFPGVKALDNVEFNLKRGEVHALCGENGAGKSTLIKILTGIYNKDSGTFIYEDEEMIENSVKSCRAKGISLIPQEIHLAQDLSVAENICMTEYPLKHNKIVDWNEVNIRAKALISKIEGANDHIKPDSTVKTLSMGQQQLVEIMKAISTDLKVIAFDEPTSSLSEDETEQLFKLIKELSRKGITIIYVSHRLNEIFRICDRVTVLKDGKYVDTKEINQIQVQDIISMMVGREMAHYKKAQKYTQKGNFVLEVDNLNWKNRIKNVSIKLQKGEILGLYGIVGAGRTETARLIFGLEKKDTGSIKLFGQEVQINSPQSAVEKGIGFVTEDRRGEGLSLISSIKWNISMPFIRKMLKGVGVINHVAEKKVTNEMVDKLNIKAPSIETQAGNLSGGNQQKIVISKWLGAKSEILIFDEPTRGIDVGAKAEIYRIMEELVSKGKSIIMISSELPELMALSDRLLVYRDGEINAEFEDVATLKEKEILHYAIMDRNGN